MTEMREPYAYIGEEIERLESAAVAAREESARLCTVAEISEMAARHLSQALHYQSEADAGRKHEPE